MPPTWMSKSPNPTIRAMQCPHAAQWSQAIEEELASLHENKTWVLIPKEEMESGHRPLGGKWVYKVKRDVDGNVARFKARLVIKGYLAAIWRRLRSDLRIRCKTNGFQNTICPRRLLRSGHRSNGRKNFVSLRPHRSICLHGGPKRYRDGSNKEHGLQITQSSIWPQTIPTPLKRSVLGVSPHKARFDTDSCGTQHICIGSRPERPCS